MRDGAKNDIYSMTYFKFLLEVVRGVFWPPHFLALVWTGFWGGCLRDQAAVHRLGILRSLTLISQMMQSSLRRLPDVLFGTIEVLNEKSEMVPPRLTALSVPEYRSDIRSISFGGTPQRPQIFQRESRFTELNAFQRSTQYASSPNSHLCSVRTRKSRILSTIALFGVKPECRLWLPL